MSNIIRDVFLGLIGLTMGCGGTKEVKQDAAPPKKEEPKCDDFEKDKAHVMVDQDSYDTMHILWGDAVAKAQAPNWHRHTRVYFDATSRLYGVSCTDPSTLDEATKEFQDGIKIFFQNHYAERAKDSEDGILVLIGGIAPETVSEKSFDAAIKTAVAADETQKDFGQVVSACYHFNKATEKAKDRFTDKVSGARLSASDKASAREEIEKAEKLIAPYLALIEADDYEMLNQKLDDHQQEILFKLIDAIAAYKRTLGRGGGRVHVVPTSTKTATPPPPTATATATATSTGKTVPNPF